MKRLNKFMKLDIWIVISTWKVKFSEWKNESFALMVFEFEENKLWMWGNIAKSNFEYKRINSNDNSRAYTQYANSYPLVLQTMIAQYKSALYNVKNDKTISIKWNVRLYDIPIVMRRWYADRIVQLMQIDHIIVGANPAGDENDLENKWTMQVESVKGILIGLKRWINEKKNKFDQTEWPHTTNLTAEE